MLNQLFCCAKVNLILFFKHQEFTYHISYYMWNTNQLEQKTITVFICR
uniref:Uncharacterized protein n=1 Tax=Arundo donax TaxID=35708 RepID=A0A0A9CFX2_ARUDO